MLTRRYIEALLVDEDLADDVWKLWDAQFISDQTGAISWWLIAAGDDRYTPESSHSHGRLLNDRC